jgi:hypothetical protein
MSAFIHIEHGCWCEDDARREAVLNTLYPDRCQIPGDTDSPNQGRRTCVRVAGHEEPCRGSLERPGGPCHYCGALTDPNAPGPGCSACWRPATIADLKAFAAEEGLQTTLTLGPESA